ncbi:hypothetical protein Scep_019128 [Stephania cephalantha]|uniref:Uncharacterized protein n=1 Tax=Stephania cephalantha TaxID=152367 RepID=A0AAP0NMK0_9MAGN
MLTQSESSPSYDAQPSTPSSIPLSWPPSAKLTVDWLLVFMSVFDWSSRNLRPSEFPSVLRGCGRGGWREARRREASTGWRGWWEAEAAVGGGDGFEMLGERNGWRVNYPWFWDVVYSSLVPTVLDMAMRYDLEEIEVSPKEVMRTVENNVDHIRFADMIKEQMILSMHNTVIVKLLMRSIGYKTFSARLFSLWNPKGE